MLYVCLPKRCGLPGFCFRSTTQAFITSLKHFFGRRGKCVKILSDNAKNFILADIELKKIAQIG